MSYGFPASGGVDDASLPDPYTPPDGTFNITGNVNLSGSLTVGGLTAGSVLFAGTSGLVSEDTTNFVWDDTNNQLVLGSGTAATPAYTFASDKDTGLYRTGANGLALALNGAASLTLATTGGTLTQAVSTSGSPTLFTLTGAAHTSLAASIEASDVNVNLARTVQFATGALTTQRAVFIQAPTYAFVGASTLTDAFTLYVDAAPAAGTNATITNRYAAFLGGSLRMQFNPASGFPVIWLNNATGGGNNMRILFTNSTVGQATTDGAFVDLDTSNLNIKCQDALGIVFATSNTNRWTVNSSGHLLGSADNTYDIGASGSGRVANIYAYSTINTADGTAGAPGFRFVDDANVGIYRGGTDILGFSTAGTARMTIDATGDFVMTQGASTSGSPTGWTFTGGAHTTLAASTEAIDVDVSLARTVQFATGALTTQRAMVVRAPTYAFAGASTLTDAYTFAVTGPPVAGTNATLTRAWAGFFGGPLELNGTPTDTNMILAVRSNTVNSVIRIQASDTGTTSSDGLEIGTLSSAARVLNREAGQLALGTTALNRLVISAGGTLTHTMSAQTSGSTVMYTMTGAANTGQTASTEASDVDFQLDRTVQFATGALTTQRAFQIANPTYAFVGASTITDAATLYVEGAPVAGTNATITNSWALWVDAGLSRFDGAIAISDGAVGAPSIYFQSDADTGFYFGAGPQVSVAVNGAERGRFSSSGFYEPASIFTDDYRASGSTNPITWSSFRSIAYTQTAQASATFTGLTWTGGAHTAMTASTEASDVNFNLARTVEFATGALTTQRAFRIQAPTYAFVGASTMTQAITVAISGAPTQGTNATITQTYTLLLEGGAITQASAAGAIAPQLGIAPRTVTWTGTTQITAGSNADITIAGSTYTDASALTMDTASAVNVTAPSGAGSCAITQAIGYRIAGNVSYATHAAGFEYNSTRINNHTVTFTATTGITSTPGAAGIFIGQITLTNSSAHTITNAASLYISGALIAGGSVTITNNYAIWVDAGIARFDGDGTTVFAVPTVAATDTTITRKIRILDGATTYWVAATTSQ